MAVARELLDLMVCPLCHADLRMEGTDIACTRAECALVFAVKDDIPVMLIDDARRPCPKCAASRDWDEKSDTLSCSKCGTTFRPAGKQAP